LPHTRQCTELCTPCPKTFVASDYPVSIIVPHREADDYLEECPSHCLGLDYLSFEVVVLPDASSAQGPVSDPRVRFVSAGSSKPSLKRGIGMNGSSGEICAFLDSMRIFQKLA